MKKFHTIILAFLACFLSMTSSCGNDRGKKIDEAPLQLFEESVNLINSYSSKIKIAQDSTTVDSLSEAFDKQLTDINFSFPPQTDMKLTQQENDSLAFLLFHLKEIKQDKLKLLSNKNSEITDSLSAP